MAESLSDPESKHETQTGFASKCPRPSDRILISNGIIHKKNPILIFGTSRFFRFKKKPDICDYHPRRCKTSLVGQSAGLSNPRSSVRFLQTPKNREINFPWIWATYTFKQGYKITFSRNKSNNQSAVKKMKVWPFVTVIDVIKRHKCSQLPCDWYK